MLVDVGRTAYGWPVAAREATADPPAPDWCANFAPARDQDVLAARKKVD